YVSLPTDYVRVANILKEENPLRERILSFPQQDTPLMSSLLHSGFVGFDPLRSLTSQPVISTLPGDALVGAYVDAVYRRFNDIDNALSVCRRLGIRWIVIRWDNNFAFGGEGDRGNLALLATRLLARTDVSIEFQ